MPVILGKFFCGVFLSFSAHKNTGPQMPSDHVSESRPKMAGVRQWQQLATTRDLCAEPRVAGLIKFGRKRTQSRRKTEQPLLRFGEPARAKAGGPEAAPPQVCPTPAKRPGSAAGMPPIPARRQPG